MRLTVLGSGTTIPDPDRGCAGFAVQAAGASYWMDAGSGTLHRSARFGVDPLALTGVILSHRHPDHAADLGPLLFARRTAGVPTPLRLLGAEGLADHLDALRGLWGDWVDAPFDLHELPLDGPGSAELAPGLVLHTEPANHPAGALHLAVVSGDTKLTYSGDTGPSPGLVRLATGADLLVCECANRESDGYAHHLAPSQVAAAVAEARPREVWLTHLYPRCPVDEAVATVAATGVAVRHAADGDAWTPSGADLTATRPG